jgi:hypothetical protein
MAVNIRFELYQKYKPLSNNLGTLRKSLGKNPYDSPGSLIALHSVDRGNSLRIIIRTSYSSIGVKKGRREWSQIQPQVEGVLSTAKHKVRCLQPVHGTTKLIWAEQCCDLMRTQIT